MNSIKIIFFDIDGTLIDMRTTRISSYRSLDHDCQWRGSGHYRKRARSCQCLDHRFHLRPPNCHRKGKGRRCQSRCVCGQKRQAQEKESMMPQSQKSEYSASEHFNQQSRRKILKKVRFFPPMILSYPQTIPKANLKPMRIYVKS